LTLLGHIHLQHPYGLVAVMMLPWLLWSGRKRRGAPRAVVHPAAAWLRQSFVVSRMASPHLLRWLVAAAWVIWCVALAEPQWVNGQVSVSRQGRDIMLMVDLSGSMVIRDFSLAGHHISRLRAVKHVLAPFIEERAADRVGLVVFGEDAYVQTPLTYDHALVRQLLNATRLGLVGERTAIGKGIALAVKHLKQAADIRQSSGGQVIVLLTDGRNNAGAITPVHAAGLARAFGIRIYTVGVGARLPRHIAAGLDDRLIRNTGSLNEGELKAIAKVTGGAYFRATDTSALASIAARISHLEKVEDQHTVYFESVELYPELIWAGLAVFALALIRGRGMAALP